MVRQVEPDAGSSQSCLPLGGRASSHAFGEQEVNRPLLQPAASARWRQSDRASPGRSVSSEQPRALSRSCRMRRPRTCPHLRIAARYRMRCRSSQDHSERSPATAAEITAGRVRNVTNARAAAFIVRTPVCKWPWALRRHQAGATPLIMILAPLSAVTSVTIAARSFRCRSYRGGRSRHWIDFTNPSVLWRTGR